MALEHIDEFVRAIPGWRTMLVRWQGDLSEFVHSWLDRNKRTKTRLANDAGMKPSQLSRVLHSEEANLELRTLARVCAEIDLDVVFVPTELRDEVEEFVRGRRAFSRDMATITKRLAEFTSAEVLHDVMNTSSSFGVSALEEQTVSIKPPDSLENAPALAPSTFARFGLRVALGTKLEGVENSSTLHFPVKQS